MAKPKKKWTDHKGNVIPLRYVPAFDIKKEKIVESIVKEAEKVSNKLKEFKTKAFAEADKLYTEMLKENNIEASERKGCFTLTSFDKGLKIEVAVQDIVDFNDNINLAQQKLGEYIDMATAGASNEIQLIVNNAFKTKKGRLDKASIFGLFSLDIRHPLWIEAMELIKKSIETNSTRRYLRMWIKDENGKYNVIPLDFASI